MLLQINAYKDHANEGHANNIIFEASVSHTLIGHLDVAHVILCKAQPEMEGAKVIAVQNRLETAKNGESVLLLIAFQFGEKPDTNALARYVTDREPVLHNHGGRVVLSAVTTRTNGWAFDGLEIIKFPSVQAMQQLMEDTDYHSKTAQSSKVFGGAFAVAQLELG